MGGEGRYYSLSVEGDVGVGSLEALHADALAAARQPVPIVLNLDNLGECDIAFVQLVDALRRDVNAAGGHVALREPASGVLLNVLERGGFLSDPERHAFWLCEESPA